MTAELGRRLRALHEAAGKPTGTRLISLCAQMAPAETALSKQALSDWLNGKCVPSDRNKFHVLVAVLEKLAANRNRIYQVRGANFWERLRAQAQAAAQAKIGARTTRSRARDDASNTSAEPDRSHQEHHPSEGPLITVTIHHAGTVIARESFDPPSGSTIGRGRLLRGGADPAPPSGDTR